MAAVGIPMEVATEVVEQMVGPNLLGQVKQATGGFSGGLAALAGLALASAVLLSLLARRRPG